MSGTARRSARSMRREISRADQNRGNQQAIPDVSITCPDERMAEFDRIFGCNLGKPRCRDAAGLTISTSPDIRALARRARQTRSWRARSGAACDERQCLAAASQGKRAECAARPDVSAPPDRACEVGARTTNAAPALLATRHQTRGWQMKGEREFSAKSTSQICFR